MANAQHSREVLADRLRLIDVNSTFLRDGFLFYSIFFLSVYYADVVLRIGITSIRTERYLVGCRADSRACSHVRGGWGHKTSGSLSSILSCNACLQPGQNKLNKNNWHMSNKMHFVIEFSWTVFGRPLSYLPQTVSWAYLLQICCFTKKGNRWMSFGIR